VNAMPCSDRPAGRQAGRQQDLTLWKLRISHQAARFG
jgi:hypothetical protein